MSESQKGPSSKEILSRALHRFDGMTPKEREKADERRRTRRYDVALPVEVHAGERKWETVTRDLSKGGAYVILAEAGYLYGKRVELRLAIPGEKHPLICEAEVRWASPEGLGVQFIDMPPRGMYLLHRVFVAVDPNTDD